MVRQLEKQWEIEAQRHGVRPLADSLVGRVVRVTPRDYPPPAVVTLRPAGGPVSDEALPRLLGGGTFSAVVEVPAREVAGVLFALGDHNGGFAAYSTDGRLSLTIASAGGEISLTSPVPLTPGLHDVAWTLEPRMAGGLRIVHLVDGNAVATVDSPHGLPHAWQHGGTSITLGYDRGLPVSDRYRPPFPWTGTIHTVTVAASDPTLVDKLDVEIALQVD